MEVVEAKKKSRPRQRKALEPEAKVEPKPPPAWPTKPPPPGEEIDIPLAPEEIDDDEIAFL